MHRAVEVYVLINFAVIGLSHALAPRAWGVFFQWLHGKGEAGVFAVALLALSFGSIILAFHPVWSGWPLVVTLLGCAQVFKALLYLSFPRFGLKQLARVTPENPFGIRWAGLLFLVATGLLGWKLWRG